MTRARLANELVKPLGWLPEAHKWGRVVAFVVVAGVAGIAAAWTLGALAAVLIVGLVVAVVVALASVASAHGLVTRVNALEEAADDREREARAREERKPRLEIVRHQIIPRAFITQITDASTGETREGGTHGTMLIVDVANQPVREAEGEEALRVSGEITVMRMDGTVIVDGSRGHWVDASLGDYERTIPAGASAVPMDVIAKLDGDPSSVVYSERGFGEWHLHFTEEAFMVDVVVKGHNTARVRERLWLDHEPGNRLRVVKRERLETDQRSA